MLNDAIHSHNKKKNKPTEISPEIRLNLSASIDASFIHSEQDRLEVYNNIFSSTDDGELAQIKSDVEDRYGQLPEKLELLIGIAQLRIRLKAILATTLIAQTASKFELRFAPLTPGQIENLIARASSKPDSYTMTKDFRLLIRIKHSTDSLSQRVMIQNLLALIDPIALDFGDEK